MVSTIRPQLFRLPLPVESPFQSTRLQNCHYRVPEPIIEQMNPTATGAIEFTLSPAVADADIRYTTDGSYPTVHSPFTPLR